MRAVEQVLLYWSSTWRGKQVVMHVDNRAIAHGMANRTIRGASMAILRRCMLLAAEFDLELERAMDTHKGERISRCALTF